MMPDADDYASFSIDFLRHDASATDDYADAAYADVSSLAGCRFL